MKAYRSRHKGASGTFGMTFNPIQSRSGIAYKLTCGRCIGCRIDRSQGWAARCLHEKQMHPESAFVTLTFDDAQLPKDGGVHVRDLQLFLKRLRKSLGSKKIRFFACGEYGGKTNRPHYHSIIFNHDFSDKKLFSKNNGNSLYTSEALSKLWPHGHSTTGAVTYQSAAYTARYVIDKINGELASQHYLRPHPVTGEVHQVKPEFMVCSRRPGIGRTWFDKYHADVFPSDFLIVDRKKVPVPRFYTQLLEEVEAKKIKMRRLADARKHRADTTPARLKVRETVLKSRLARLKREL